VISDGAGQVLSLPPGWTSLASLGIALGWAVAAVVFGYVVFLRRARTFAKEV
jgi:hypothetical protein